LNRRHDEATAEAEEATGEAHANSGRQQNNDMSYGHWAIFSTSASGWKIGYG
jgi:hypothetical protein